jgi:predicted aldo/keto reductase-like oxidoreductase
LRTQLAESLERLRTDVIDIYQIHDVTPPGELKKVRASGTIDELKAAKAKGTVRFIGLSTHAEIEDIQEMITCGDFDVLTVAYNLTHHKRSARDGDDLSRMPKDVFPLAREHDVGLTIMKPFGGGRLTRRGPSGRRPVDATKALRFVIQEPAVATVTPGIGSMAELEQALAAGEAANALSDNEIAALKEQAHEWGTDFCRQCGYCEPCVEDVPIRKIMLIAEKLADKSGDVPAVRGEYAQLETNGGACIACGECEEKCPYDLPIMERIRKAHEALA